MSKLVLIDGNAILHRAYHALPPLTTKKGEVINAVYGLVSMLLRVIQDLKPTHIAFCFDRPEPTFRQKEFRDYQAQRPPLEKDLSSQFSKAKAVAGAMNIPVYEMAGFEADDLIGTIANSAVLSQKLDISNKREKKIKNLQALGSKKLDEVVIVTGDKDILQLVDDKKGIRVYMPIRGLSDAKLMKEGDVFQKLGVRPEQIPDYKALVGDPSDNYPGIAGIGPKTATSLLEKYKSFDGIYKHLDEIPDSISKKLVKGRKNGELSLALAKILTNVDFEVDLEKMKGWRVDSPQVLDLFTGYGFKTLTNRVKEVGKQIVSENQMHLL